MNMTSLTDYRDETTISTTATSFTHFGNEEIVIDERGAFSPSDLVQQKLQSLLPDATIPVSCLHGGREVRRYNA